MSDAEHVHQVCDRIDAAIQAWLAFRSADTAGARGEARDVPAIVKNRRELDSIIKTVLPLISGRLDNLARLHLRTNAGDYGDQLHTDLRDLPTKGDECERRIRARYDRLLQLGDLIGATEANRPVEPLSTLDLPGIVEAVKTLYRTIETPPPA